MLIFLFSLFDYFNFSTFEIVFLAGVVQLICSSGTFSVFHSIHWIVFQDLSCYVLLIYLIDF